MLQRLASTTSTQRLCWLATALWIAQPFLLGPLLSAAWREAPASFTKPVAWASWLLWLIILISLLVRLPLTLTIARIGVAGTLPAALWAAIEANETTLAVLAAGSSLANTAVVLAPGVADHFIDGASYGNERRFVLRPPGPVLLVLVFPAWAVVVVGTTTGPLLLADQRWLTGGICFVIGLVAATLAFNALVKLTSRFVVFVPNGLVLHDRHVLAEPVLFTRQEIVGIAPALASTNATDLSAAALGIALELTLSKETNLPLITGHKTSEEHKVKSLLISPSRPADVLREAQQRGLTVS